MEALTKILPSDYVLIIVGINLLMAWSIYIIYSTGQISLGNAGFMAVGAYSSSIFTVKFGMPLPVAIFGAVLLTGLFGTLVGFPALRLRGLYLAILTLGMGEAVQAFFRNWEYTGGASGFKGMSGTSLGFVWLVVLILVLFFWKLSNSRLGRAFEAVGFGGDEAVASALGLNATYIKLLAFAFGAGIAALAGAFYAHHMLFIRPEFFGMIESFTPILFVIFGGVETFWGAALGSIILTLFPEYVRAIGEWRFVFYGVMLIIMMSVRPQGLISKEAVRKLRRTFDDAIQNARR